MNSLLIAPILGVVGMVVALVVYQLVMKYPDGEDKVKKILKELEKLKKSVIKFIWVRWYLWPLNIND